MDDRKVIIGLIAIISAFVVGVILHQLQTVLVPFVIAVFLSYLFKPLVLYLKKKRIPVGISLIVVALAVAAVLFMLALVIYSSVGSFIAEAPKYQTKLNDLFASTTAMIRNIAVRFDVDINSYSLTDAIQLSSVTGTLTAGIGSFVSFLGNFILIMLFMMFILAASGNLKSKMESAFREQYALKMAVVLENIDRRVRQYLFAKTLVSLGTGLLTSLILWLFGVDFALFWGFLAFLLNYIPNVGSLLATVFPVILSFLQFDSFSTPLIILLLLFGVQFSIGNVVEPKTMEFSLNLSSLLVLVSLLFWGWLWGIPGAILAVPLTSIFKIICENIESLRPVAALMSGNIGAGTSDI